MIMMAWHDVTYMVNDKKCYLNGKWQNKKAMVALNHSPERLGP